ncbi:24089_t:CDS:2, partial [Gigaspora margarita]
SDSEMHYQNSNSETITANPAVLQSCILSSFVISHPPITRDGQTYTLENYLNTFLYPASQLNSSIEDLKYAIYSRTNIYEKDGKPAFPQIDFTEFRMNSSDQIFCKLDFDSFLLNTTDLSIIERPIQFFCFTNFKLVNIPHFQLGQFGELGLFKILIFFPKMYTFGSRKKTFLTDENLANWYDDIFFPSIISQQDSTPDIIHHYPSTFKAYKLKSKKDSGYFFHHPYGLSPTILINLTNSMRSKINIGIEFVSNDLITPNSIYWSRNSATDLLSATGTTFTTNVSRSRIDNWLHTYDIAGAAGEAKEPGIQNKIFYTQAYHVEKEAFSASKSTLLQELNEKDAKNNSLKVNKACKATIIILNEIINTRFGARLEYRIGFDITKQVLTIIQLKLNSFLDTNPFYIIPTHLVSKVKIAKLNIFLNLYNRSFNSLIQSPQLSIFNNETFRICLLILMKTINQSFDALPNTKKYFGDSSIDNSKNTGTLEIHSIMRQSNTAWLLSEIFNIDDYSTIITSQYFQQNQQPTNINNDDKNDIDPEIKEKIRRLVAIITSETNYNNEMVELVEFIWTQFIID